MKNLAHSPDWDDPKKSAATGVLDKKGMACFLHVTTRSVDNMMTRGDLPFWKIGKLVRFNLDDVIAHLNQTRRIIRK